MTNAITDTQLNTEIARKIRERSLAQHAHDIQHNLERLRQMKEAALAKQIKEKQEWLRQLNKGL